LKKFWLGAIPALIIAMQLVPYGRNHANPPARKQPDWNHAETLELARRACFDCHSNETRWPWYAKVAPVSWFTYRHVQHGRRALNFSEWDRPQREAREAAEEVEKGAMPLRSYLFAHPEAKLTLAERETLIKGLRATLGE